jgi:hypothetical protein
MKGIDMDFELQIIKKNGENEFAVLPYSDYLKMKQALDDYEDLIDLRKAKNETVNEPGIPFKDVEDLIIPKKSN